MLNARLFLLAPLGRLLLALPFIVSAPGKLMAPIATAGYMASAGLPDSTSLAVAVGLFEIVAALALIAGFKARWAALALALFTLAASLMFHHFWDVPVEQQFVQQLLFTKNIAIVGGLLFLTGMGAGAWSVEPEEDRGEPRQPATSAI